MGADGGSYAHRSEMVKTKARVVKTDKDLTRESFKFCALSKQLLRSPVVVDLLGKLYKKDAVLEYFIDKSKYGDGEQICGYLKGIKDLVAVNLTPNPTYTSDPSTSTTSSSSMPFACPLSLKEMSGTVPFIAIRQCGCVFSEAAIRSVIPSLAKAPSVAPREVPDEAKPLPSSTTADASQQKTVACPNCGKDIEPSKSNAVISINPPEEVQEMLLIDILAARAAAKASKKRKAGTTDTGVTEEGKKKEAKRALNGVGAARSNGASPAPPTSKGEAAKIGAPTTVKQKLAEQEQKRLAAQANMSEAVRSMFKPSVDPSIKDETTGFFGRTFNRYA